MCMLAAFVRSRAKAAFFPAIVVARYRIRGWRLLKTPPPCS